MITLTLTAKNVDDLKRQLKEQLAAYEGVPLYGSLTMPANRAIHHSISANESVFKNR
ncbi:hypothetical protein [Paenibacillus sp. MMO-58]|uniref:hypothetical protein n=1 Tax=Paenibacillus sp. MMO-58 TaxID=3081290 RepID=UPI0030178E69